MSDDLEDAPPVPLELLFVDDDQDILTAAELLLGRHGMALSKASTPAEAEALLGLRKFDVILLDLNFQRGDITGEAGLAFLEAHLQHDPRAVVVVITGHSGLAIAVKAMRLGATDFVMKPWHNERLIGTIRAAIASPRPNVPPPEPTDLNLDRSEKTLIIQALNRHAHNISLAAKDLGLTRAALYRRMEKHGL
ncbi:MAG TPA: response regulator [Magnetospirillaceae bacterium]|nr:response regulator [Magnetospirillaceae bacterium]